MKSVVSIVKICFFTMVFFLSIIPKTHARTYKLGEYEIKAAYIYNFAKFVEWPKTSFKDSQSPINVCIVGDNPFGSAFESIHGKTAKGRKIVINSGVSSSFNDLKNCNMAFISSSERENIKAIVESASSLNILTVADTESFINKGVIINLAVHENRVIFSINTDAAKRSGLQISSVLLRLARTIGGEMGIKMNSTIVSNMPIKTKLILICLSTVGLSLLLSGIVIVIVESYAFRHAYIQEHIVQAGMIGYNCSASLLFNDNVTARDVLQALKNNPRVIYASVFAKNGILLADYSREGAEKPPAVHIIKEEGYRFGINYFTLYQSIIFDNEQIGTIFIESDLKQLYRATVQRIAILTFIVLGSFLVAILLISRLQHMITGPIKDLVDLTHRISKEKDFSLETNIRSNDETGLLARGFNEMLTQIRKRDAELEQYSQFLKNLVNQRTFEVLMINEKLKKELMEHQQTGKALKELEQKFYNLFDNLNDAAFVTDVETGNIIETNKQGEALLGINRKEIFGMKRSMICRLEKHEKYNEYFLKNRGFLRKQGVMNLNADVYCKNGNIIPVEISSSMITVNDKRFILELFRDVTERRIVENKIRKSLEEKEVLLKEIHHRVKNNMQIATSLINLQIESAKDIESVEMLKNCVNRIKSMALIHEKLYQSQDLTRIDFADYVRDLIDHLLTTYHVNLNTVKIKSHIENVFLPINTAIPCGLIINELVSNSLKYAFKYAGGGEIEILFSKDGDRSSGKGLNKYILSIKDNGCGIPEGIDAGSTKTLGLKLVYSLTIQIGGTILPVRDKGAGFEISFMVNNPVESSGVL